MGRQWGRLYSGTRHHPKIRILRARLPKCWKAIYPLMEMSFEADDEGRIEVAPGQPYTLKELAKEVGESVKNLSKIVQIFVDLGMISYQKDTIQFLSWKQRQFGSDAGSIERTRKWRERKSASPDRHGDVTDTGQKEKEKEKDIKPPVCPPKGDDQKPLKIPEEKTPLFTKDFLRFWEAYPNRAGGQEKAWRKWQSRKKEKSLPPIDYLIEAIEKLKRWEKWRENAGSSSPWSPPS